MSVPAVAQPEFVGAWRSRRGVAIALSAGLILLGLLFHEEVVAAVHTWMDSTAYNHCFLVIPIAAYLIWDRRESLRGLVAEPMPWLALAGIPLALAWLLAERLGIMEGRQLVAISFVELLALAVLGWRLWWQLAGPLLYLFFLVPFGEFLTPKLQDVTTVFVQHGLDFFGIPAFIDGYVIEIPEGTFYIAEACAGLRFLIASIAFGFLYALLMYRSPWRRVAFVVASVFVPIVANGLRALGIVTLGHLLGSAQAAATDHILYGWIFFSLVILLLIALGLPFREDIPSGDTPPPQPPAAWAGDSHWRSVSLASFLVVLTAAISPVIAMQLDRLGSSAAFPVQALDFGADCADVPLEGLSLRETQGHVVMRRVACDGVVYDVRQEVFSSHVTAAPVMAAAHRFAALPDAGDEEVTVETDWLPPPEGQQRSWRLTRTTRPGGPMVAVAIWVNGQPAAGGLAMRAQLAWTSLTGARIAPVVIAVAPELHEARAIPSAREATMRSLSDLLQRPELARQIGRLGVLHE